MKRYALRFAADAIFLLHLAIVVIAAFGFLVPSIWYLYMAVLVGTLISEVVYGYCIVSKWEFDLRKKINPAMDYDYRWATYYTYKLTNRHISNRTYTYASIAFLVFAILINLYFRL